MARADARASLGHDRRRRCRVASGRDPGGSARAARGDAGGETNEHKERPVIFLGIINNAGSDVKNNLNTSTPFAIPYWVTALRLQPSAATMMAVASYANDSAFAPASTAMLQLGAVNSVNDLPMGRPSAPIVQPT